MRRSVGAAVSVSVKCFQTVPIRRSLSTVQLASDKYAAPAGSSAAEPLVVLHGLYGSKQNWRSLARAMAQKLQRDIIALVRRLSSIRRDETAAELSGQRIEGLTESRL